MLDYTIKTQKMLTAFWIDELRGLKVEELIEQQQINKECTAMYDLIKMLEYMKERGVSVADVTEAVKKKPQG